jgi:hypothetical protein
MNRLEWRTVHGITDERTLDVVVELGEHLTAVFSLLQELEWSVPDGPGRCCPSCLEFVPAEGDRSKWKHKPGCKLDAMLNTLMRW